MAVAVTSPNEAHAGIPAIGIVDGQPDGHGLGRSQRPVAGVLMPGHGFAIPGKLAEEVGAPADDVGAEEIPHHRDDARFREQVPGATMGPVGSADRIAVSARIEGALQQNVEVVPDGFDLIVPEDGNGPNEAIAIESSHLIPAEQGGVLDGGGMESKIPLVRREFVSIGSDLERIVGHGSPETTAGGGRMYRLPGSTGVARSIFSWTLAAGAS